MRLVARVATLVAILALVLAGAVGWAWWTLQNPIAPPDGGRDFVVPEGENAKSILERLETEGLIANAALARAVLVYALGDPPLKAGEYRFERPRTTPEVLDKLARGSVVAHALTLVEGLTLTETAAALSAAGFGREEVLLREMENPARIADIDPLATNLEGYLYPDTYAFARGTSEREIVDTLVDTFRLRFENGIGAPEEYPGLRDLVILASIVEKEAAVEEERPVIAAVYANRLRRGIALYADPTIIYGMKLEGVWDGNLRKEDLRRDGPYNTYVRGGLPPGPICSPGIASLKAAASPADVDYLYFVSRNDGSHVFSETLREHNRAVQRWQREYWQQKSRLTGPESSGINEANPDGGAQR